jgi:hypothetical protein
MTFFHRLVADDGAQRHHTDSNPHHHHHHHHHASILVLVFPDGSSWQYWNLLGFVVVVVLITGFLWCQLQFPPVIARERESLLQASHNIGHGRSFLTFLSHTMLCNRSLRHSMQVPGRDGTAVAMSVIMQVIVKRAQWHVVVQHNQKHVIFIKVAQNKSSSKTILLSSCSGVLHNS